MATSTTAFGIFGHVDVAITNTAIALGTATQRVISFVIKADDDNADRINYGGSDVATTTQTGLAPGESFPFTASRPFLLSTMFINGTANDGVDIEAVIAK